MRWTEPRIKVFKRKTDRARKLNRYEFTFARQIYVFSYAEYLIRFLESVLPTKTKNETTNETPASSSRS